EAAAAATARPTPALSLTVALAARDVEAANQAIAALQGFARRPAELGQIVNTVLARGLDGGGDAVLARLGPELSQSHEGALARAKQQLAAGHVAAAVGVAREVLEASAWSRAQIGAVEALFLDAGRPTALAGLLSAAPATAGAQG